jgi:MFS family permease
MHLRALLISLGPATGLGLGRFAYSLLVPAMRADLGWSFALVGWMNAANAAGYLCGAMLAPSAVRRIGAASTFTTGLVVLPISLGLSALSRSPEVLSVFRLVAGVAAGLVFVGGGTLAVGMTSERPDQTGLVLGTFYGGAGIGMVVSSLCIPPLIAIAGSRAWPVAWIVLGVLSILGGVLAGGTLRTRSPVTAAKAADRPASITEFAFVLLGYLAFGVGSIGYLTFIYGYLASSAGGWVLGMTFWCVLGGAAVVAPWIWHPVIDRLRGGAAFALLVAVNAAGAGMPFVLSGLGGIVASAVLFGSTFFTVVAATSAFVGRMPANIERSSAIRAFTVAFGVGQLAGPILIGWATDRVGDLRIPLVVAVGTILLGAALGVLQQDVGSVQPLRRRKS